MSATFFCTQLMDWYDPHRRPLPWKEETNPYFIWLSEIILQQTRVEQGRAYYERFCARFPTVAHLAAAPEDEVLKHWEGLGYYSRARNLHAAARQVMAEWGGVFPSSYAGIRALRGVGPYTAAAIASFAYQLPHAVVDGNVLRVLARFTGSELPIDSTAGKKYFTGLAQTYLDVHQPGRYNQAIMDFGALVCKPRQPDCAHCPLQPQCQAFATGQVAHLPVKGRKPTRRERYFHYLLINLDGRIWLHRRPEGDIWAGLYDFPLIETPAPALPATDLWAHPAWQQLAGPGPGEVSAVSVPIRHELTHQRLVATFWEIQAQHFLLPPSDAFVPIERKNLCNFALPKVINLYLADNSLLLKLI